MNIKTNPVLLILVAAAILILGALPLGAQVSMQQAPQAGTIIDTFEPGYGEPVGRVVTVTGTAAVVHPGADVQYRIVQDTPLFKGDTVKTFPDSRVELGFADASRISVGASTVLTIDEALYDVKVTERSAFMTLASGKLRCWVKKLVAFRRSEVRVKTSTSIAGVRGSDFVVWETPEFSEITALDKTSLEVIHLAAPEAGPVILTDFTRVKIESGQNRPVPTGVDPEEISRIMQELPFSDRIPLGMPVAGLSAGGDTLFLAETIRIPEILLVPPGQAAGPWVTNSALVPGPWSQQAGTVSGKADLFSQILHQAVLADEHWAGIRFPDPP